MRKLILIVLLSCCNVAVSAQSQTELYELIKKFLPDSSGYENVGDWAVGQPKTFPVKWKEDRLIMSEDTSINFYRLGTADIKLKGRRFMQDGHPIIWNVMLKGPRSGYISFSILSAPSKDLKPEYTVDSVFGKKPFTAKLLKSCAGKTLSGFYYYELKLPKKDVAFIKLSWLSVNGNTAIRIDCYNSWSNYAAKLNCPK
jgi:hypothetical protein